ncbi:hypothetical protein [Tateyamaria omphalii]|uniref:Uncharacterized protein n=1 Tax=Tateyamaria omphalii TaxID=299262 RepID=A0A1P8N1L5_9RHOB|nr:hypothetical protein [Tateyamaria omphalii]APX14210.1 hypothetical protein BWR18_20340 [Tateyamaria omphalii]
MTLAHLSIDAHDPQHVATVLAHVMGGTALPFPPCPGACIAFDAADDGTAIEVYPIGTHVQRGADQIAFAPGPLSDSPVATHICLTSALPEPQLLTIGAHNGWTARTCNRGPFSCVEIWLENRVLIEVLDPAMTEDYRQNMSAAQWRAMFGMAEKDS